QRRDRRIARLHAGINLARREPTEIAKRRNPQLARGRRHARDQRLVRWRRFPCWLWRSNRAHRSRLKSPAARCRSNEKEISHRWRRRAYFSVFYFLISPL